MNNQPLPKPNQVKKNNPQSKNRGSSTPPPSALKNAPVKQNVVFDGNKAKSRVPLSQKPVSQQAAANKPLVGSGSKSNEIKMPPTSLSALSSMSSNTIPENKVTGGVSLPEKTVLGRPIPQAIRGEKLPKALNLKSSAAAKKVAPAPTVVQGKTSPVPVAPSSEISKGKKVEKSKTSGQPKFASEKKSIFKYLPYIVGGAVVLTIVIMIISRLFGGGKTTSITSKNGGSSNKDTGPTQQNPSGETAKRTEVPAEQTNLVYWGLWEPNEVMDEIIADFETANPGVKITYIKQSHKDYRERLQTALASDSGPDIFRFHASWVPMLISDLSPIPSSVISTKEFKENYYPIVADQLVVGGQYIGVPLMYDGLALYYNEEILNSANETPPSTWAELRLLAAKLTVKSASGIERAGLAIGNTVNTEHFSDILAVLMLQNGASFSNPNSQETRDALLFYTNFVLKDEVWNSKLPSSTIAFARGDVAMMFAPSWRAHEISAQNPNLKFKTMTLPQLSDERITWGSYWAEGINTSSENKDIAANFLGFLSSDENLKKLYSKQSEIRAFGEIYPKISLAGELVNSEVVASYLDDALYARGWYLNSFTHDNGVNDQIIEYYKDGINAILNGENVDDVLITIEAGTKQVLGQYGISSK